MGSGGSGLKGFTYGFMEHVFNGQRILYHGGDIAPFHSMLVLIPNQNLGSSSHTIPRQPLAYPDLDLLSFLDHYYPQEGRASAPGGFRHPGQPLRGLLSNDAQFLHHPGKSKYPRDELDRGQAFQRWRFTGGAAFSPRKSAWLRLDRSFSRNHSMACKRFQGGQPSEHHISIR